MPATATQTTQKSPTPAGPADGLTHLLQPLDIGATRVKNRLMMTAQTTLFGKDHLLGDRHVEYYRERAKGGAGLFICEQQGAHRLSKGSFFEGCSAWDPASIPQFAKLAQAVHEHGARQFVQLYGTGVHDKGTTIFDEWHPLWGVSKTVSVVHHEVPMVMEAHHIREVAEAFGQSALNVKCAGVDGVEVHGAHSYLVGQFLSRAYNKRDDAYGGSVANRARFALEVGEAIRARAGADFTLGIRLSYDEFLGDAGIVPAETDETLDLLAASGLFDFFSITAGGYHTLHRVVAPTGSPKGEFLAFARRAKDVVGDKAKIFAVGRITDLAMAERALADGAADMIAMTRAQMAEPHLLKKTLEGRAGEVVHCVGANECINRAFYQRPVTCVMNPAVGREHRWRRDNLVMAGADARKIVVVGAGPGGLRCADLLGRRGHRVVLFEKEDDIGGHLTALKKIPSWKEWGRAIESLRAGIVAAGVDLRLGVEADQAAIAAEAPDVVVVATGASWDKDGASPYRPDREHMPGAGQDNVLDFATALGQALDDVESLGVEADQAAIAAEAPDVVVVATGASWDKDGASPYRPDREHMPGAGQDNVLDFATALGQALDDVESLGRNVVIVDETGGYPPLALAHMLASAPSPARVRVVTPCDAVGGDLVGRGELFHIMPKLTEVGVAVSAQTVVDRIDGSTVALHSLWGGPPVHEQDVDTLVLAIVRSPRTALYDAIRDGFPQVVRLGDCLAPRSLVQVMYEAEEIGREL